MSDVSVVERCVCHVSARQAACFIGFGFDCTVSCDVSDTTALMELSLSYIRRYSDTLNIRYTFLVFKYYKSLCFLLLILLSLLITY